MSNTSSKKSFGFFILVLAAVLALAAGVYFVVIHGTFGLDSTHNGACYDPLVTGLLIGGALIACGLTVLKKIRAGFRGGGHRPRRGALRVRS